MFSSSTVEKNTVLYIRHRVSMRIKGDILFILPILGVADFYMETLLECGVYRVQCTPSVTHQQIRCQTQHALPPPFQRPSDGYTQPNLLILVTSYGTTSIRIGFYLLLWHTYLTRAYFKFLFAMDTLQVFRVTPHTRCLSTVYSRLVFPFSLTHLTLVLRET